jgi:phosphate acetyltransferase
MTFSTASGKVCPMKFIETVFEKLKRHPKRIVFPDGTEPRVLKAAQRFCEMRLGPAILLGGRLAVEKAAAENNVSLKHIIIIDPETADDLPMFAEYLKKLRRYRDVRGGQDAEEVLRNPNYFGAMMIQHGHADGLVGGVSDYAGALLRPLIHLVKPLDNVKSVSSCMMFDLREKQFGSNGFMVFADCAVIPEPTVEQLATIAVLAGRACRQMTGEVPRVALLSFSTKGSSISPAAQKIAAATALAKQKADAEGLDIEIDGELQADTALLPDLAAVKAPSSLVAGRANVLIFPDLNAGNAAAKLVHLFAGGEAYGNLTLGLSKPAGDLSRGATEDEILGMAAIVGLQAIQFRKLYGQPVD